MRAANKMGVKWVLIFGQKEALEDFIILRDMDTGTQKEIKLDEVVEEMKGRMDVKKSNKIKIKSGTKVKKTKKSKKK